MTTPRYDRHRRPRLTEAAAQKRHRLMMWIRFPLLAAGVGLMVAGFAWLAFSILAAWWGFFLFWANEVHRS